MNVNTIRTNIAAELAGLDVRTYAFWPDSPSVPAAIVTINNAEYGQTFDGGAHAAEFGVTMVAGTVDMAQSQLTLDGWLSDGSESVAGLLLAATVADLGCSVVGVRLENVGPVLAGEVRYLAATFAVSTVA